MSGLGIFLAPIAAILASDFWLVKKTHIDVPALYRRHGRYRYNAAGTNWRAVVAFLVSIVPNLPGMAAQVNSDLKVGGAQYIYNMFYLYGFTSAFVIYAALSHFFPATETLIPESITEEIEVIGGVEYRNDGLGIPVERNSSTGAASQDGDEKGGMTSADYKV